MAQYAEYNNNEGVWQHFLREEDGQSAQCKLCHCARTAVNVIPGLPGMNMYIPFRIPSNEKRGPVMNSLQVITSGP